MFKASTAGTIDNEHSLRGIKRKECFDIFKIKSFPFFCMFFSYKSRLRCSLSTWQRFEFGGVFFSVRVSGFSIFILFFNTILEEKTEPESFISCVRRRAQQDWALISVLLLWPGEPAALLLLHPPLTSETPGTPACAAVLNCRFPATFQ